LTTEQVQNLLVQPLEFASIFLSSARASSTSRGSA
jgi:hypothetical protein